MRIAWRAEMRRAVPAYIAVAVAAVPVGWVMGVSPEAIDTGRVVAWWGCTGAFLVAFTISVVYASRIRVLVAAQVAQSLLALGANWLIPMAIEGVALTGILLVVAAAGLAHLPRRVSIAWIGVQTAVLLGIYADAWPLHVALAAGVAYAAMQMVIYSTWRLALAERERRVTLESSIRELQSTRAMLEETVRAAERAQVARDLHDVVGHHLVALGLQLDAAAEDPAPHRRIADARRLVRLLLADVREVVAELRSGAGVDLRAALGSLATDGPGPRVIVAVGDDTPDMPGVIAQALLRCAQEALTNARKHAEASTVRIDLGPARLTVADDGRGPADRGGGFGLAGMAARCREAGCALRVEPGQRGGTVVVVELPVEADA